MANDKKNPATPAGKTDDQQEQKAGETQATTPVADPVAAEVSELKASNEALLQENADTRDKLAKALSRLDALEAKASPQPVAAAPGATDETPYERQLRQVKERRAKFLHHVDQVNAALEDGPRKYQVSLESESRMTRIVGAANEHEAEAKYKAYFSILSTKKTLSVALLDDESAEQSTAAPVAGKEAGTLSR